MKSKFPFFAFCPCFLEGDVAFLHPHCHCLWVANSLLLIIKKKTSMIWLLQEPHFLQWVKDRARGPPSHPCWRHAATKKVLRFFWGQHCEFCEKWWERLEDIFFPHHKTPKSDRLQFSCTWGSWKSSFFDKISGDYGWGIFWTMLVARYWSAISYSHLLNPAFCSWSKPACINLGD